jgi:transcription-repair coupling factor (superfamily II helicase)
MAARAEARYSFATHDTIEDMLRFLTTETESRIPIHEVTMIPHEAFPSDDKAAGKVAALAQAAKEKAEEKTADVIEKVSDVAKDVAVKTGELVEKIGDKVAEAGRKILKLV